MCVSFLFVRAPEYQNFSPLNLKYKYTFNLTPKTDRVSCRFIIEIMGFLNPGKRAKRVRSEGPKVPAEPKKIKRVKLPTKAQSAEPTPIESTKETGSILERLPTEILHEIFLLSGLTPLPLVCKTLNHKLQPSKSLKVNMLKNFIVDLNNKIVAPEMSYKDRYALDKMVLNYRFITTEILQELRFDTVLPFPAIASESKNRLILYYDKLNQRLLETMRRAESTEEEINRELARIANDNFNNINAEEDELADAPEQEVQDYPESFYEGPFTDEKVSLIEYLHTKGLRFMEGDSALGKAIAAGASVETLEKVLECTESQRVQSPYPLICAFEQDSIIHADWVVSKLQDRGLLNEEELWLQIYKGRNANHLKYLEQLGASPSHEVLGLFSASLI